MYVITTNRRAGSSFLNSFLFNGNGNVNDIFVFGKNCFMSFCTEEDASKRVEEIKIDIKEQTHYIEGLKSRLIKYCDKLIVCKY